MNIWGLGMGNIGGLNVNGFQRNLTITCGDKETSKGGRFSRIPQILSIVVKLSTVFVKNTFA